MRFRCLILTVLLALPAFGVPAAAQNQVHDVDISVELATDGSAHIREVWQMTLSRGTEVYLDHQNLGDIKILDLTVSDETGETYKTERSWDTDRSFERKKNRCGLHAAGSGYEICWGIGEYGRRTYTVDYTDWNWDDGDDGDGIGDHGDGVDGIGDDDGVVMGMGLMGMVGWIGMMGLLGISGFSWFAGAFLAWSP